MLESEPLGFGVEVPPLPGVLLIPGNIAFQDEFFEVLVLVSNVAPEGSELVITAATAELELPLGDDGFPGTAEAPGDDPLAPAITLDAPQGWKEVAFANQATGDAEIGPGEDAAGDFLLVGKRVGTHRVTVDIEANLTFPGGPSEGVELHGSARGTVVVRDRNVALTIHHPDVVRAGDTYTVGMTVTNTGEGSIALMRLTLDPTQITGAWRHDARPPTAPLRVDPVRPRRVIAARPPRMAAVPVDCRRRLLGRTNWNRNDPAKDSGTVNRAKTPQRPNRARSDLTLSLIPTRGRRVVPADLIAGNPL